MNKTLLAFVLVLSVLIQGAMGTEPDKTDDVDSLLQEALDKMIAKNYAQARRLYTQALNVEDSCRVHSRRATVNEILGDLDGAIDDMMHCYDDPKRGDEARAKNGALWLKLGNLQAARDLVKNAGQPKSQEQLNKASKLQSRLDSHLKRTRVFRDDNLAEGTNETIMLLRDLGEIYSSSVSLCVALGELYYQTGDITEARREFQKAIRLMLQGVKPVNYVQNLPKEKIRQRAHIGILNCFAATGDYTNIVRHLKAQLESDPDDPSFLRLWKRGIGAVARCIPDDSTQMVSTQVRETTKCIDKATELRKTLYKEGDVSSVFGIEGLLFYMYQKIVSAYTAKPVKAQELHVRNCIALYQAPAGNKSLSALEMSALEKFHKQPNIMSATCMCAGYDIYLIFDSWKDLEQTGPALERARQLSALIGKVDPSFSQGFGKPPSNYKELLQKIERLDSQRDYYKDLGVSHNATDKEISKAYHKIAMECHPDRFISNKDSDEAKTCEERFRRAAEAKEVLSDPEKKARFDRGEYFENQEGQNFQGGFPGNFNFQQFTGGFPGGFQFPGGFSFNFGNAKPKGNGHFRR